MLLALLGALATPISKADPSTTATMTGIVHMNPLFFKSDGIRFASDYMVG